MQVVSLKHLEKLTGPFGLYQHAHGCEPNLAEGYCTDDNSRAVRLMVALQGLQPDERTRNLTDVYWQFLEEAHNPDGSFKNFRDAKGNWLDDCGTEETHAHAVRALAAVAIDDDRPERRQKALGMIKGVLPRIGAFNHPRSAAEALVSLSGLVPGHLELGIKPAMQAAFMSLKQWFKASSQPEWPWFGKSLTYANALLPHGILMYGKAFGLDKEGKNMLEAASAFLVSTTVTPEYFQPTGNKGWHTLGQAPAKFDQQPLDAALMFEFLLDYEKVEPGRHTAEQICSPYLWFFGRNCVGSPLATQEDGACYDGLTEDGPNINCGAESTLAYLFAEVLMQNAPGPIKQAAERWRAAKTETGLPAASPT